MPDGDGQPAIRRGYSQRNQGTARSAPRRTGSSAPASRGPSLAIPNTFTVCRRDRRSPCWSWARRLEKRRDSSPETCSDGWWCGGRPRTPSGRLTSTAGADALAIELFD
ncbi:hypothetical protein GQ55_9G167200 [Panicum hallii var. hallii]|uniref:Uncharacterized protein n=1 Tax=Panicum hallii var. hallii TaxID=1504633 RepID=A0A2T7C411_9POAL|nr:hypothetical protein GQ55_9G167200 [Panicum hallii var. hallii]